MARHRRGAHGPRPRRVAAVGIAIGVVLGGALIAAAAIPLPTGPPTLAVSVRAAPAPPTTPTLEFPAQGEAAVAVPSLRFFEAPGNQSPVPIASLTKLMTAEETLRALPLSPSGDGPTIVVTPADVREYRADLRDDQSSVAVVTGEVLTERNLLDGLLVHSANNYATLLSRMVAGSTSAMVERMNARAEQLGLSATTYADASGYNQASRSNARDQVRLASLLMHDATFAEIVRQTSVTLPVAGVVTTFTPFLGLPGVVGIKTGYTSEALGCDVMAYARHVAGRTVLVVAAVLGQSSPKLSPLQAAGRAALTLAKGTARRVRPWQVTVAHATTGSIGWPTHQVGVVALRTITLPVFPGIAAAYARNDSTWSPSSLAAGQRVTRIVASSGTYSEGTSLVTASSLARPTLLQRLR